MKVTLAALLITLLLYTGCKNEEPEMASRAGLALSFDDYFVDNWSLYKNAFDSLNVKVTFYVCCYHNMSKVQRKLLKELRDAGHEIAYHSTNHGNCSELLKSMSIDKYLQKEIYPDLNKLQADGFVIKNFAYPYGLSTFSSDSALRTLFNSMRKVVRIETNQYTYRTNWLWMDNIEKTRIETNPFSYTTKQAFYEKLGPDKVLYSASLDNIWQVDNQLISYCLDYAVRKNKVLQLHSHYISNLPGDFYITPERLLFVITEAHKRKMKFYTVNEIVNF